MRNKQIEAGIIGTTSLLAVSCLVARNVFPQPFWLILRFAFLTVVGAIIGYCAYKGTAYIKNAVTPSDLEHIFNDTFRRHHDICPTTGDACINTKCAPEIMQTYAEAKCKYLSSYCDPPSLWSFGWQWFLFSASAIALLFSWGAIIHRDLPLWGIAFAAIPIIAYFLFDKFGKQEFICPNEFSVRFPPMNDVVGFEDVVTRYCVYLNSCSMVMESASECYKRFKSIAAYVAFAMVCIAIMEI